MPEACGARCQLCREEVAAGELERHATLDLCHACHEGSYGARLSERGIFFQELSIAARGAVAGSEKLVAGAVPYDVQLHLAFSRESLGTRLGKLFSKEVEVGDAVFDDAVFVRTDDADQARALLESPSLRAAVLALVSSVREDALPVTLDGNRIEIPTWPEGDDGPSDAQVRRAIALVLAALLERLEATGAAPRPDLLPFPDLSSLEELAPDSLTRVVLEGQMTVEPGALVAAITRRPQSKLEEVMLKGVRLPAADLSALAELPGHLSLVNVEEIDDEALAGLRCQREHVRVARSR